MQQYRAGEEGKPIPPRSERFYKVGDDWHFQVRGGTCYGPYACRGEAERAVQLFFQSSDDANSRAKGAVVHPFGNQLAKRWRKNHKQNP